MLARPNQAVRDLHNKRPFLNVAIERCKADRLDSIASTHLLVRTTKMVSRSKKSPRSEYEFRQLAVSETGILIIAGEDIHARAMITICAELDEPVLRARNAEISVHVSRTTKGIGGSALGVADGIWRISATIAEAPLDDLLMMVAAERLSHVQVHSGRIIRGKAAIRSLVFSTAPIDQAST